MKINSRCASEYNDIFFKCFIIRIRKHKRRRRQKDIATEESAKELRSQKSIEGILYQSERWSRTLESLRTPETEQDNFFVPSVSFLVKSPNVFSVFQLHVVQ